MYQLLVDGPYGAAMVHVQKSVVQVSKCEVVNAITLHQVMVELSAMGLLLKVQFVMRAHVQVWLI